MVFKEGVKDSLLFLRPNIFETVGKSASWNDLPRWSSRSRPKHMGGAQTSLDPSSVAGSGIQRHGQEGRSREGVEVSRATANAARVASIADCCDCSPVFFLEQRSMHFLRPVEP